MSSRWIVCEAETEFLYVI